MGSVWVAEHVTLRTQVAVKFLSATADGDSAVSRFEQEATTAARIKSPHVVQVLDHGFAPGDVPYMVMELLEGETLGARLQRRSILSVLETAAVMVQTCRVLSKAHSLQIVHRDIKPDNLFLTDSAGELFVKILDFGIAKNTAEGALGITQTGVTIGTPYYMSPEQIVNARNVTPSTDLWAMAAVAYRCLTGKLAFRGETFGALAISISNGQFTRASGLRPDLPKGLDAWFARAFRVAAADRFPSAKELSDSFLKAAGLPMASVLTVASGLSGEASAGSQRRFPEASSRSFEMMAGHQPGRREVSADAATVGLQQGPFEPVAAGRTGPSIPATVTNGRRLDSASSPGQSRRRKIWSLGAAGGLLLALSATALMMVDRNRSARESSAAPATVVNSSMLSIGPAKAPTAPAATPDPAPISEPAVAETAKEAAPSARDGGLPRQSSTPLSKVNVPAASPASASPQGPRPVSPPPASPPATTRKKDYGF